MEAQPQLLLLQKTMLMAEGITLILYPETNMWLLARPLMEDCMWTNSELETHVYNAINNVSYVVGNCLNF